MRFVDTVISLPARLLAWVLDMRYNRRMLKKMKKEQLRAGKYDRR